jgi:uncharacterized protein YraI
MPLAAQRFGRVGLWLGVIALAVSLSAVTASPTSAASPTLAPGRAVATVVAGDIRSTVTAVRLRRGPGTGFAIIRVLRSGTSLVVLGSGSDSAHRTWYHVSQGGGTGWVAGWLTRAGAATVNSQLATASSAAWRWVRASSYGIGDGYLYGHMACGGVLTPTAMAVAHRSLPCGTRVLLRYHGRTVVATVRDRGPYIAGRIFDLGPAVCRYLGNCGLPMLQWQLAR